MPATLSQLEILDLRHFSGPALRPLLEDEAVQWAARLAWDYSHSIELLLDYISSRSLTGYVAYKRGRTLGYGFGVCEAAKAVVGDLYAYGETEASTQPTCALLLEHLIETLQATPGIARIESQLLLFPQGALEHVFRGYGFYAFPRCFLHCNLKQRALHEPGQTPENIRIARWSPEAYQEAAQLIQAAYAGHMDSDINDQYRSLGGAQRFLHNIVQFPGCGVFDPAQSWLARHPRTGALLGMVLCSRVDRAAAHITQLCVHPAARGTGVGSSLLRTCLTSLATGGFEGVSLTVTQANTQALHLYHREGFRLLHSFEAWVWESRRP